MASSDFSIENKKEIFYKGDIPQHYSFDEISICFYDSLCDPSCSSSMNSKGEKEKYSMVSIEFYKNGRQLKNGVPEEIQNCGIKWFEFGAGADDNELIDVLRTLICLIDMYSLKKDEVVGGTDNISYTAWLTLLKKISYIKGYTHIIFLKNK